MLKIIIADLLLGSGKRGIDIEEQIRILEEIAYDLEEENKKQLKEDLPPEYLNDGQD